MINNSTVNRHQRVIQNTLKATKKKYSSFIRCLLFQLMFSST